MSEACSSSNPEQWRSLNYKSPRRNLQPTHTTWDDLSETGNWSNCSSPSAFPHDTDMQRDRVGVTASFYKAFKRRFEYFRRHTATFQWTTSAKQPHDDKWQRTKEVHWAKMKGIGIAYIMIYKKSSVLYIFFLFGGSKVY